MRRWLVILLLSLTLTPLTSWAVTQQPTNFASQPEVKVFINEMVKEHHFKRAQLVKLFSAVKVRHQVMKSIRTPLEQRPWYTYQRLFVTEWRIREGVEFWTKYQTTLTQAEAKYGVPASIIVATIGVETKYGRNTGEYPVIEALTNISFSNSSRAKFFRSELEEFLLLTREQHLDPLKVMGSYAGAIGQPQFMPSSYRRYAVSASRHGRIDLSHNEKDIISSIANYYKQHGWHTNQPVALPASIVGNKYQFYLDKDKSVRMISKSTLAGYGTVPASDEKYKLIELRNYWGNEYWLGFHNFQVIKRYNPSDLYAMAVFQLSNYITVLKEKMSSA
jgi:membrane-bound lytic murein transglycosylase B